MLKTASHVLIDIPYWDTVPNRLLGDKINKIKNKTARTKFVIGPATEILPFLEIPTKPEINTAPGAANTKPAKNARAIATTSIISHDLNSAQQPYLCATTLWANSCSKKPNPTAIAEMAKLSRNDKEGSFRTNAKAIDMAIQAFIKSIISSFEVLIFVLGMFDRWDTN